MQVANNQVTNIAFLISQRIMHRKTGVPQITTGRQEQIYICMYTFYEDLHRSVFMGIMICIGLLYLSVLILNMTPGIK